MLSRDANNETLPGRAECFERPDILRVFPAQDVAFAVRQEHTKISGAWRVPAVFHFRDVQHLLANLQFCRALVAFESGIAFNAHGATHPIARAPLRLSASSAFHAAPKKIITVDNSIQISNPITAANPP